jgi:hypothetical protein
MHYFNDRVRKVPNIYYFGHAQNKNRGEKGVFRNGYIS